MKYTPEITKKICDSLKGMSGRVNACAAAGISYWTFLNWMETKPQFSQAIKEAEEETLEKSQAVSISCIFRAMQGSKDHPGQWTAAAWWLERNFPDRFCPKTKLEHSGGIKTTRQDDPSILDQIIAGTGRTLGEITRDAFRYAEKEKEKGKTKSKSKSGSRS